MDRYFMHMAFIYNLRFKPNRRLCFVFTIFLFLFVLSFGAFGTIESVMSFTVIDLETSFSSFLKKKTKNQNFC